VAAIACPGLKQFADALNFQGIPVLSAVSIDPEADRQAVDRQAGYDSA
jgi:hypothetical protein